MLLVLELTRNWEPGARSADLCVRTPNVYFERTGDWNLIHLVIFISNNRNLLALLVFDKLVTFLGLTILC